MGNSNSTHNSELAERKNNSDSDSDSEIKIVFSELENNIKNDIKNAKNNIDEIFYKSQATNKNNNKDSFNTISLEFTDSPKETKFHVSKTTKPKQMSYHKEVIETSEQISTTSEEIIEPHISKSLINSPTSESSTSDIVPSRNLSNLSTTSDSDRNIFMDSNKPKKNKVDTISDTSPVDTEQKENFKKNIPLTTTESTNSLSQTGGSDIDIQIVPLMKGGAKFNSFSESEIDIQIVPLMKGGAKSKSKSKSKYESSENSPFITSEVFKKTLEKNTQKGGAKKNTSESEFDSNKLLNIIMQMGGEDESPSSPSSSSSLSESVSDKKEKKDDSDNEDDDEEDDEDDEDDDFLDDSEDDEDSEDKEESSEMSRMKRSKLIKRSSHTHDDDDSSSSSSSSSSESSESSESSSSSSSSSSESHNFSQATSSLSSFFLPTTNIRSVGRSKSTKSSDTDSVYIMSSDSSIGSRNINLLSFDEPTDQSAWNKKDKKDKKGKKDKKDKKAKKY